MELICRAIQNRSYRIYLDWDILDHLETVLAKHHLAGPFFIISDTNVFRLHGKRLLSALHKAQTHQLIVRPGEASKSLPNWKRIQDFLLQDGADRHSVVIAFGGGVIGDLAGFSASTFMRGLPFIQIPTTVLSQADSSIGAKVAVNHPKVKNLVGNFYQPRLVIIDPSLLSTLPKREFSAGLGEAIKYGVIADRVLFDALYEHIEQVLSYNKESLTRLIVRCIKIKIRIVEEDERETGLRKILNFGHTIGHALEQATQYRRLRHGEAVAWGMLASGWLAVQRNMWDPHEFEKLKSILFRAKSLHPLGNITAKKVLDALQHDKKKVGNSLHFVLPERTGKVTIVKDIQKEEVLAALQFIFHIEKILT